MTQEILPEYLRGLNPEQLEAVRYDGSRLLILAGAGTGKTRVITTKIAYLVREKHIFPESILAVTFTNKAALEMRERAMSIEPACERAIMRTFHSFGAWFMRRNAQAFNLKSGFTIYDSDDSTELVHSIFPNLSKRDCGDYAFLIAKAKDYCLLPDAPNLDFISKHPEFRRIYAAYEERLHATGNVDFGDLILRPALLLEKDEAIRNRTQQRFKVILVDEYQDSNVAQFRLLQQLASPESMLCVVGDDDQSIYRFRGAEVRNILNFQKVFPETRLIRLERNYRSHQGILDLARSIVVHNERRLGKRLLATRPGGIKPALAILDDQDQEIEYCARVAKQHINSGGRWRDIAILYRTNAQSLGFERLFPKMNIPYRIVGALRFYEREEIKDMLAFLAFLANPNDEISFKRIVNKPSRGIGATSIDKIVRSAIDDRTDLLTACKKATNEMHGRGKEGLRDFLRIIEASRDALSRGMSHANGQGNLGSVIAEYAKQSGLVEYYRGKDSIAGSQKEENIDELVNAASDSPLSEEGLLEFLDTVMLDQSQQKADSGTDAVTLITMHNTKGLEFPMVIVTGLEQGLFPRNDEGGEELEEQRRLFYVAVTRAKDILHLTACRWRRMHGRLFETTPSRFLMEIDPKLYELWGAQRRAAGSAAGSIASSVASGAVRSASAARGAMAGAVSPVRTKAISGARSGASSPSAGMSPDVEDGVADFASSKSGSPLEWAAGMTVYHDEYGNGVVIKVAASQSAGPLVIVRFDSGKVAQFFPKYTKKLEKVEH